MQTSHKVKILHTNAHTDFRSKENTSNNKEPWDQISMLALHYAAYGLLFYGTGHINTSELQSQCISYFHNMLLWHLRLQIMPNRV